MNAQVQPPPPFAASKPMKILMLLFCQSRAGTYFRALPWARQLVADGHSVTVMCVSPTHRFHVHETCLDGVRIIETPRFCDGRRTFQKLCGLSGWGLLDVLARIREIRHGRYDLVHVFEHHPNVALPIYLTGRRHIPLLVADWCDHYGPGGFRRNAKRPRLDRLYRILGQPFEACADYVERDLRVRADGVTVISRYLRDRACKLGVAPERICLLPGGAEVQNIRPLDRHQARQRLGLPFESRVAAFFGAAQFDLDIVVEAFVRVVRSVPQARFLLVGIPNPEIERAIERHGLTRQVVRTGWIADTAVEAWLACADLFVLPMRNTPVNQARWPNKIGFYMAAGRPTVCSNVGDVAELVRRERIGLLAENGAEDFADAILTLFRDPARAATMGLRARAVAERDFDSTRQGRTLEQAYRTFANRPASATACTARCVATEPPLHPATN